MSQLKKDGKMHNSLYGIQEGWESDWEDTFDNPVHARDASAPYRHDRADVVRTGQDGFIGALGPKVFRDATTG